MVKIKKGAVVDVKHSRSGYWVGIATEDFDTEKDEWYSLALAQTEPVEGMSTVWEQGEDMPARKGLCRLKVIEWPCGICNKVKPLSEFWVRSDNGKIRNTCKGCQKKQAQGNRNKQHA